MTLYAWLDVLTWPIAAIVCTAMVCSAVVRAARIHGFDRRFEPTGTITSTTAFTQADVGRRISGPGIPDGTTIGGQTTRSTPARRP